MRYALGGRLPRELSPWVLADTTEPGWVRRHLTRAVVQLLPVLVLCITVVPVPLVYRLSAAAGGLLVVSGGLSSVISIICAALGIFYSRRGRARVDRGETPKHRGLAQAGYIIGIVSMVLAVLATIGWAVLISDEDFWDDLDRELDDPDGTETRLALTALRAGALILRAAASLL